MSNTIETEDKLGLRNNNEVLKLLLKNHKTGDPAERVLFSDYVMKINMRDQSQERVLLISSCAIYNLLPGKVGKCRRRIAFEDIECVTASKFSKEFVCHVPKEYDYRYVCLDKSTAFTVLKKSFKAHMGKELVISESDLLMLKDVCVTKVMGRKEKEKVTLDRKTHNATSDGGSGGDSSAAKLRGRGMTGWADEKPKATMDDFQLLKVIGRGSFGKVMMVRKIKGDHKGRIFAMKILKKEAIVKRNQVEHTKSERKILEEINHPFLMRLYYAFQSPTKLYMVMDYLTGGEMFFHLKNDRRFTESRAKMYIAEITLGLHFLHKQNIMYRDLKPENILMEETGHIRLTDFGLSKEIRPGEFAKTFCGTPEYLAPEIIIGNGHAKEVDWWSLGILLYEMLVGIPPFYSENVHKMYDLIQNAPLRIPSWLSYEANTFIKGLLQRNPVERLGYGPKGGMEVMRHPFFADIDWEALYDKKVTPEFIPVVRSKTDTSNVDEEFTREAVVDSVVSESKITASGAAKFDDFTYAPKHISTEIAEVDLSQF